MSRELCPNENSECRYYNSRSGCFSDLHHLYGQARARQIGRIAYEFGELPQNKEQTCRAEHDEIHATDAYHLSLQ
jgi:hypothetical protein